MRNDSVLFLLGRRLFFWSLLFHCFHSLVSWSVLWRVELWLTFLAPWRRTWPECQTMACCQSRNVTITKKILPSFSIALLLHLLSPPLVALWHCRRRVEQQECKLRLPKPPEEPSSMPLTKPLDGPSFKATISKPLHQCLWLSHSTTRLPKRQ